MTADLDHEMMKLEAAVGVHAFKLSKEQYKWAMSDSTVHRQYSISQRLVFVAHQSPNGGQLPEEVLKEYAVDIERCECSCIFMVSTSSRAAT